jgi:hypothetical protein
MVGWPTSELDLVDWWMGGWMGVKAVLMDCLAQSKSK